MFAHSVVYVVGSFIAVMAFGFFGFAMTETQLIALAAVSIALIGVPHGGLDHWAGKRLLAKRCGKAWPFVFFPAYLAIASIVVALWLWLPGMTIVAFFVLSAWHFGCEEGRLQPTVLKVAAGGLVIWDAALFRPDEMTAILDATIMSSDPSTASGITSATRWIGAVLLPIGLVASTLGFARKSGEAATWSVVPMATVLVTAMAPILFSFTFYFCIWHSWLGLRRLRLDERLSVGRFLLSVMPLSMLSVVMVAAAGVVVGDVSVETLGQADAIRLTFIGLASIAVPHIVLHELGGSIQKMLESNSASPRSEAYA